MNTDAWIELYRRELPPLYRTVSRRVGGARALSEDVVQETWLRAVDTWSRRGVPADPGAWLRAVAANLVRNHFRSRRESADVDVETLGGEVEDASAKSAEVSRAASLQAGLARLPKAQAELLARRYLDGVPSKALAVELGLGERALEGRLRRARAALARRWGRDVELEPAEVAGSNAEAVGRSR